MGRTNVASTTFAEPLGFNLYCRCLALLHVLDLTTVRQCAAPLLCHKQNFVFVPKCEFRTCLQRNA